MPQPHPMHSNWTPPMLVGFAGPVTASPHRRRPCRNTSIIATRRYPNSIVSQMLVTPGGQGLAQLRTDTCVPLLDSTTGILYMVQIPLPHPTVQSFRAMWPSIMHGTHGSSRRPRSNLRPRQLPHTPPRCPNTSLGQTALRGSSRARR